MSQENVRTRFSSSSLQPLLLLLLVGGILFAGFYFAPQLVPAPKVGIVRLDYDIFSLSTAEITRQLAYAREHNDEIKAVVLVINSPGGSASYSEELYLDVLNTRHNLPVLASIDLVAASGAYYMAAGAEEIYAKPTSFVGSIGVIASFGGPVFIDDQTLTTGPYKLFGGTSTGTVRQVEMAKYTFLDAVRVGRGERLIASLEELSRAEIYSGIQAHRMGLTDGLMGTDEVIQRAAELANLRDYEVVELYPLAFPPPPPVEQDDEDGDSNSASLSVRYEVKSIDAERLWAVPTELPPGLYYRHFEPFSQ